MDGVVGVELRAPKAGALPGCATPRLKGTIHSKALSNFLPAPTHGFLASWNEFPKLRQFQDAYFCGLTCLAFLR
jgi:hypothetical protein